MSQSLFSRLSLPAFESIQFQGYDPVCEKLNLLFTDLKEEVKGKEITERTKVTAAYSSLIQRALRSRFKMKELVFVITEEERENGFAFTPTLTKNNALVKTVSGKMGSAYAGKQILKDKKSAIGSVDLVNGTVSGFFCDCPAIVGLTSGLVYADRFPPEELTALVMHEVGHVMVFFETLAYTFSTCFILASTVHRLSDTDKVEEKMKIIKELEDDGVQVSNKDILTGTDDPDAITVSIFSDIYEQSKSEFGSSIYDMRSWESLADQFSSRMGMTVPLAKALDKLHKSDLWSNQSKSTFSYWMGTVARWVAMVGLMTLNIGFSVLLLIELIFLLINPTKRIYDKPGERLERLRQEIIQQMKSTTLHHEHRVSLNQDLDLISNLIKETNDKEGYHEKIWLFFSSDARNQKSRRLMLQDLQSIANNNLFASANLLKTLK